MAKLSKTEELKREKEKLKWKLFKFYSNYPWTLFTVPILSVICCICCCICTALYFTKSCNK
jgi:hypothetical protein